MAQTATVLDMLRRRRGARFVVNGVNSLRSGLYTGSSGTKLRVRDWSSPYVLSSFARYARQLTGSSPATWPSAAKNACRDIGCQGALGVGVHRIVVSELTWLSGLSHAPQGEEMAYFAWRCDPVMMEAALPSGWGSEAGSEPGGRDHPAFPAKIAAARFKI